MGWDEKSLKAVSIQTIGNGFWLGTLVWLVLGLWLDEAGFVTCWLGATILSWFVAIWRGARRIACAETDEALAFSELRGGRSSTSEVTRTLLSALEDIEKEVGSKGLAHIKQTITENFIQRPDYHQLNLRDTDARSVVLFSMLTAVWNKLTSGEFHTGPRKLDETGAELMNLREYALQQLVQNGEMTEQEAEADTREFMEKIEAVG